MSNEGYIRVSNFSDCFHIYLTRAKNWSEVPSDQPLSYVGLTFDSLDKEAVFFRALGAFDPAAAVGGRISVEDHREGKWEELWTESDRTIEMATAKLPLLRRLKEEYHDAFISPDEVSDFREECREVITRTNDSAAISALNNLIAACDEALPKGLGLVFASD